MQTSVRQNATIDAPVDLAEATVNSFLEGVSRKLEDRPPVLLIDCAALENVASSHVTVLWKARQLCEDAGISLSLTSPSQNLIRVLRLLELVDFFDYEDPGYPKPFSDVVIPTADGVSEGLDKFLRYLITVDVSDRVTFELRTIYYEIMTNIRTHAKSLQEDAILVTARASADKIEVVFLDSGPEFNPIDHISEFNPQEAGRRGQTRGFGITMISRLATEMSYVRRNDNTNVLTVMKQR